MPTGQEKSLFWPVGIAVLSSGRRRSFRSPLEVAVPEPELFTAPADLTLSGDAELTELETQAVAAYDQLNEKGTYSADDVGYAQRLASDLDRIRAELRVRATRAQEQAALAQQETQRQMAALQERVHGPGEGGPAAAAAASTGTIDLGELTQATARGVALALFGEDETKLANAQRRFASLGETAAKAPKAPVQDRVPNAVTASMTSPASPTAPTSARWPTSARRSSAR
jgi:hypothetical protein